MSNLKEIGIGFTVGIIATFFGVLIYTQLISPYGTSETYRLARESGYLGGVLALCALPNLLAFFGFLKIDRDVRARGVLLWTLLVAFAVAFFVIADT